MAKIFLQMIGFAFLSFVMMLSVVMFMRCFIDCRYIPSASMAPTLPVGTRMLCEKISLYENKAAERGVIIICYFPNGKKNVPNLFEKVSGLLFQGFVPDPEKVVVKRIIGIPGDRIVVKKGVGVFVNDKLLDESCYVAVPPNYDLATMGDISKARSSGSFQGDYISDDDTESGAAEADSNRPIIVPPGKMFVLGDNRNVSMDSHVLGFFDQKLIIARAWFMYYPKIQSLHAPYQAFSPTAWGINIPLDATSYAQTWYAEIAELGPAAAKIAAPGGKVTAELVEAPDEDPDTFGYQIYLRERKKKVSRKSVCDWITSAYRNEKSQGVDLEWLTASRLLIKFYSAQSLQNFKPQVEMDGKMINSKIVFGYLNERAPSGGILDNKEAPEAEE